ncbi:MAG: DUF1801 domain-containing protein [Mangrovibacterium sp.]
MKITRVEELIEKITEEEWLIVDVLRGIIKDKLPDYCREKISYNVPYFYGNKGICIIWPSSIPRGGIKEGVLLGFWQGNKLNDFDRYLERGTNRKIFYKIFKNVNEINTRAIDKLLEEAISIDKIG